MLAVLLFSFLAPIVVIGGILVITSQGHSSSNVQANAKNVNQNQAQVQQASGTENTVMAGTYRCWSFNVSGYGGSCINPPQAPLILNADGTYKFSSETGTYSINGGQIVLSESKIRGNGTLLENNNQIRFEYDYKGRHYTITYLKNK